MLNLITTRIDTLRAGRATRRSRYPAARAALPPALYSVWKRLAPLEFKGIRTDAFFFACAVEGLLTFFDCVRRSGQPCALPSKAADSVWHAWIKLNPIGLDEFTQRFFGRAIPHVEGEQMADMTAALANCLVQARRIEGLPAAGPALPTLFVLDRRLRMADGFGYRAFGAKLGYSPLDDSGRNAGPYAFPAALDALDLLESGMITLAEWRAERKRLTEQNGSGGASSCGSGGASLTVGGDAGCADGSGSSGSSCGSSCGGGGCGGGS